MGGCKNVLVSCYNVENLFHRMKFFFKKGVFAQLISFSFSLRALLTLKEPTWNWLNEKFNRPSVAFIWKNMKAQFNFYKLKLGQKSAGQSSRFFGLNLNKLLVEIRLLKTSLQLTSCPICLHLRLIGLKYVWMG